jgi:hypothetical protein
VTGGAPHELSGAKTVVLRYDEHAGSWGRTAAGELAPCYGHRVRSLPAMVAVSLVGVGAGACSSAPTQEESRAAAMALAATRQSGQSLGRCLAAAGYEVDADTVAGNVEQGTDVVLTTGAQKAYIVSIAGPTDVKLTILYDKGWTIPNDDPDEAVLAEVGCSLP